MHEHQRRSVRLTLRFCAESSSAAATAAPTSACRPGMTIRRDTDGPSSLGSDGAELEEGKEARSTRTMPARSGWSKAFGSRLQSGEASSAWIMWSMRVSRLRRRKGGVQHHGGGRAQRQGGWEGVSARERGGEVSARGVGRGEGVRAPRVTAPLCRNWLRTGGASSEHWRAPEAAPGVDGRLALGAVGPAHPQPLLDALLAEAVHARRGERSVKVAQADGAPQQVERSRSFCGHPHQPRLIAALVVGPFRQPRVGRRPKLHERLQPTRRGGAGRALRPRNCSVGAVAIDRRDVGRARRRRAVRQPVRAPTDVEGSLAGAHAHAAPRALGAPVFPRWRARQRLLLHSGRRRYAERRIPRRLTVYGAAPRSAARAMPTCAGCLGVRLGLPPSRRVHLPPRQRDAGQHALQGAVRAQVHLQLPVAALGPAHAAEDQPTLRGLGPLRVSPW